MIKPVFILLLATCVTASYVANGEHDLSFPAALSSEHKDSEFKQCQLIKNQRPDDDDQITSIEGVADPTTCACICAVFKPVLNDELNSKVCKAFAWQAGTSGYCRLYTKGPENPNDAAEDGWFRGVPSKECTRSCCSRLPGCSNEPKPLDSGYSKVHNRAPTYPAKYTSSSYAKYPGTTKYSTSKYMPNDDYTTSQYDKYDKKGYESQGYDKKYGDMKGYSGYENKGSDKGYDTMWEGYKTKYIETEGYDTKGYNKGYDTNGYDTKSYDTKGYNKGYDTKGYVTKGYDTKGYDAKGYDTKGYDKGYDTKGYDTKGYDTKGYDNNGYDTKGYGSGKGYGKGGKYDTKYSGAEYGKYDEVYSKGYESKGYDSKGYGSKGYSKSYDKGYDKGYDKVYNKGYDSKGYYDSKGSKGYESKGYSGDQYSKGYDEYTTSNYKGGGPSKGKGFKPPPGPGY